jgi:hypothetical protein
LEADISAKCKCRLIFYDVSQRIEIDDFNRKQQKWVHEAHSTLRNLCIYMCMKRLWTLMTIVRLALLYEWNSEHNYACYASNSLCRWRSAFKVSRKRVRPFWSPVVNITHDIDEVSKKENCIPLSSANEFQIFQTHNDVDHLAKSAARCCPIGPVLYTFSLLHT